MPRRPEPDRAMPLAHASSEAMRSSRVEARDLMARDPRSHVGWMRICAARRR